MSPGNHHLQKYLARLRRHGRLEPAPERLFRQAVVIPALAESGSLPHTLTALAANAGPALAETMTLVVVNNTREAAAEQVQDNQATLAALRCGNRNFCGGLTPGQNLFWLDAASPGLEISAKAGVGEARKLGLDAALRHLDFNSPDNTPLLFCLDADTLTGAEYLASAAEFFRRHRDAAGAVFRFRHQPANSPAINAAITEYELFMRYFVIGLRLAASPYAYHALGSAIVCPAAAYVTAGGMRERSGGEDFYFLQALRKIGPIGQINAACVLPSSRASDRAPFGTGARIRTILDGKRLSFYNPALFAEIKKINDAVNAISLPDDFARLPRMIAAALAPEAATFFQIHHFEEAWSGIFKHHRVSRERLIQAFHVWFDAFAILKFIHFCENNFPQFQRVELSTAFRLLFEKSGLVFPAGIFDNMSSLLDFFRNADESFPGLLLS